MTFSSKYTAQTPPKFPVFILADASASMADNGKIDILNKAVRELVDSFRSIPQDVRIAVITFSGSGAIFHSAFERAATFQWEDISTQGGTPMGQAFTKLHDWLTDKHVIGSTDYRPVIVLATDGQPTDDWLGPLDTLNNHERCMKADRFALAIGDDVNLTTLNKFVEPALRNDAAAGRVYQADKASQIKDFFNFVVVTSQNRVKSNSTAPTILGEAPTNIMDITPSHSTRYGAADR